ncbi:MAG TPA: hemerythrin domain-containing protein [Streptosporangiaceae bacterium]
MSDISGAAKEAVDQPQGDIIAILTEQHQRIRELFAHVRETDGQHKQQTFDELRALLAVHETAEEMVLRPVSSKDAGEEEAAARNREEDEATRILMDLENTDASSAQFDQMFAELERAVLTHAEREEREDFPPVRAHETQYTLQSMGRALRATEKLVPTHPHPAAGTPSPEWALAPFTALVERTQEALKTATPRS